MGPIVLTIRGHTQFLCAVHAVAHVSLPAATLESGAGGVAGDAVGRGAAHLGAGAGVFGQRLWG